MAEEWAPEFPGQRPPFAPGNTVAQKSGYWSPRVVDPVAQELVDAVLADEKLQYLQEAAYRLAVRAWAVVEARALLVRGVARFDADRAAVDAP